MAVLQALPAGARAVLRHDRAALLDGELWRLFTAHLIHLGWAHWALNALGLVLCGVLANPLPTPGRLLARMAVLGLGVSLMLLAFDPALTHYVGLSGVLYGLFVLTLWPQARRGEALGIAALATVLAWAGWQWLAGPVAGEAALIGGAIVAQAHAYGIASAAGLLWMERASNRNNSHS
jgi:rhomboid family GlyGly-CTERM serine protease